MKQIACVFIASLLSVLLSGCGTPSAATGRPVVRLGYFANLTHAQALVGTAQGSFARALGDVEVRTSVFNAGPAVVEALFAGELDLAYVGPSPAINAFVKSRGQAVRVIAGAAANGVVVVARKDSQIRQMKDLVGKRIATPQYGNTQDVSARYYLQRDLGARLSEDGGNTELFPIPSAEQLGLIRLKQLDAVWVPEPWGARIIHEAGGILIEEEKEHWPDQRFATTVVLASRKFLEKHPDLVERFLREHSAITSWINANRPAAAEIVNSELKQLVGKALAPAVLADAFARVEFTTDPLESTLLRFAQQSYEVKIARTPPDLTGMLDLTILKRVLAETPPR